MNGTWAAFPIWLFDSAVGGGLLLLLVWVLMKRCRQPARQQRLGEWGLLAALVLAVLSLGPAWLVVPLLEPAPASQVEVGHASVHARPSDDEPKQVDVAENAMVLQEAASSALTFPPPAEEMADAPLPGDEGAGLEDTAELSLAQSRLAEPRLPSSDSMTFSMAEYAGQLGMAYLLVVAILAGRWLLGHWGLWRLLRSAHAAPEGVNRLFLEMAHGCQRSPRLLVSSRLRVPVSCGLIQPTVIVPLSLCRVEARETLRWIFAHELSHLERRDAWACILFGLGQTLYFYLPWFWWLRRQVRLCQEFIADAAAVEQAADPEEYAQFLLGLSTTPAVPLGATGVLGNSSDLFRRVNMLLQDRVRVERRCPRWWSLAAAGGLLTLAVVVSGVSLRARAADALPADTQVSSDAVRGADNAKPAPRKAESAKKKQPTAVLDIDADIQKLQGPLEPLQPLNQNAEMLPQLPGQGQFNPYIGRFGNRQEGRLGILVQKPDATLVEQLDLPKGEGLVIEQVQRGSAAAKAELKAHDILLEFNGKPVPNDPAKFVRTLAEIKENTPVDAVVLRKGKKETIKGITLPERKAAPNFPPQGLGAPGLVGGGGFLGQQGGFPQIGQPMMPGAGLPGQPLFPGQGRQGVLTTNFRVDDRFTTRHQEGSLIITVTGTVGDHKAKVSQIQIQDGRESHKYERVAEVPEQYRDKVKNLVEVNEKSIIKIEIKTPSEDKKPAPGRN